jgi:hypothetical protein
VEEGVTLSSVFSNHATKTGVHGLEANVFCQLHDFVFQSIVALQDKRTHIIAAKHVNTLFAYFLLRGTAAVAG